MDSLPPHLLRLPGSAPGSPRRGDLPGAQQQAAAAPPVVPPAAAAGHLDAPPVLVASAGDPGKYEPAVPAAQRPRNITELRERVTPATPEPWPAGAFLLIGERGKRAHWTGTDWKLRESPGYAAGELVQLDRSAAEQTEGAQP